MSYLERWWKDASETKKESFINLVKNAQLEIVGGGWVMNDEANSHYFAIIEQVETLSKDDLASRLTLTTDDASVGPLLLSDALITIIDPGTYLDQKEKLIKYSDFVNKELILMYKVNEMISWHYEFNVFQHCAAYFNAPGGDEPLALDMGSMGKG
ncbi:Alpha-mannosidase 2 [Camellia lanceoleosa]|uniref:Alpha-mannosidase 2 n=1 Tax=Camellia lanceoleosa TaxID=1840588 RepID=A0ACC0F9K0_9ERIC|nr:Alpha-mannosidase 2 [Camellia lanceoleosa]